MCAGTGSGRNCVFKSMSCAPTSWLLQRDTDAPLTPSSTVPSRAHRLTFERTVFGALAFVSLIWAWLRVSSISTYVYADELTHSRSQRPKAAHTRSLTLCSQGAYLPSSSRTITSSSRRQSVNYHMNRCQSISITCCYDPRNRPRILNGSHWRSCRACCSILVHAHHHHAKRRHR